MMETFQAELDWLSTLILCGILQCLGLLYVLWSKPKWAGQLALLGLFLALLFLQVEAFLIHTGYLYYTPHLLNISAPFLLTLGPFTWWYFLSSTRQDLPRTLWLHFLPALLYFFYSFFFYLQPAQYKIYALIVQFHGHVEVERVFPIWKTDPWGVQGWVIVEGASLHLLSYGFLTWLLIGKKTAGKHQVRLLFLSCILACAGMIMLLSEGGVINGVDIYSSLLPDYFPKLFSSVLVYTLSILMLKNGDYFGKPKARYRKSGLQDGLRQRKIQQLLILFEQEKPFLQQSYSLTQLADHLSLSPHLTSQLINEGLQKKFFELIHDYRVKEAKVQLAQKADLPKMEYLAYELGYGSKSAFYAAFKKETGLTPLQYRKQNRF
ncbi:MAG: AraC family transcriptional regulator [Saprospiraceae bacterium]|nr:AraC family transcriptional regulator [Saprospiraceae bacterium]